MVAGKSYYGEDVKDVEEAREFRELVSEVIKMSGHRIQENLWRFCGGLIMGVCRRS